MRKGFTLIELMIVIAIIAIIAAIAIPNLLESRITANESAAAASLKSGFFAAQAQFQSGAYSDIDADGRGEYATDHREMAGTSSTAAAAAADATTPANVGQNNTANVLTLLAPTYNVADGTAIGPYVYQIDTLTTDQSADGWPEAESFWGAYAAPGNPGSDGRRAFGINLGGVVYATRASAAAADLTLAKISDTSTAATAIFASSPRTSNPTNTSFAAPYQK